MWCKMQRLIDKHAAGGVYDPKASILGSAQSCTSFIKIVYIDNFEILNCWISLWIRPKQYFQVVEHYVLAKIIYSHFLLKFYG